LIEWTGERCVPWAPDVQVVYEHMHRYLWAAEVIKGRRVLDLGSGEGFGASLLADSASEVVGVDIDERTVEHANLNWSTPCVSFIQGSALDLSMFDDASFGAVVAFEIIEHLEEQARMLAEVRRVLADDGVLIISTPDRRMYSETTGQENPFHQRELTSEEFASLLGGAFTHVTVWGQRTITGSHLSALDRSAASEGSAGAQFFIERAGEEWRLAGEPTGLYLVAVASDEALPAVPAQSTLGDCGLELLRGRERAGAETAGELVRQREEAREGERLARDASRREVRQLDAELKRRGEELVERDEYVRHRDQEVAGMRARLQEAQRGLVDLNGQLEQAQRMNRRVESSVTWQTFERVRGRVYSSLGERSLPVRTLSVMLRLGGRLLNRNRAALEPEVSDVLAVTVGEPIDLPTFERPVVSLLIPVYSGSDLTRRCLESIRDNTGQASYEVILIDDCADAETKRLLSVVSGARVIVNRQNIGYLRSMKVAATAARGEWLVLCNNDIEVSPSWLKAMLVTSESNEQVGIVAPKFVSPDGKLSEAGGIIWSDGTGVNFGRGDDPSRCQYEYTREIDYGSAAALMVRAELWRELGGFDERFVPMYYEDADLCLAARQHGWRVLYEPSAVVVHVEGGTAGTDPEVGHKRHQETNRLKFVEKWRDLLESEHFRPDERRVRQAAGRHRGPQVLVVDFRVPMWDRDAGSLRMFEIVRSLLRMGYSVTFLPDNLAPIQPYARDLQRLGVELLYDPVDLSAEFAELGPGLAAAILSRPHSASRWLDSMREYAPAATVIYDTVDLHWVRESRRYALTNPGAAQLDGVVAAHGPRAAALLELELAMVRASDATVTVTEDERSEILSRVPDASVTVIPTIHEVAKHVSPPSERTGGLLFVGGFEHPPNVDAATYLVREVMPLVWARVKDVSLTIVGSNVPREVKELAGARVDVAGWVADLEPLLGSSRALVVPVRFGAGVKGKITQGLAAGLPVVTTPVGAEGLEAEDYRDMLIGEDAATLAERIVRIAEDDELWERVSRSGQALIDANCSRGVLDDRMRELLAGESLVGSRISSRAGVA
jgi:GT2 family glycosyltransferase/SAM-dependent methyltransferase/glycosyltransferase involved in cell wall biosynthesis